MTSDILFTFLNCNSLLLMSQQYLDNSSSCKWLLLICNYLLGPIKWLSYFVCSLFSSFFVIFLYLKIKNLFSFSGHVKKASASHTEALPVLALSATRASMLSLCRCRGRVKTASQVRKSTGSRS